MTTNETDDRKSIGLSSILVAVIFFLAVAYVPSCGPVLWLCKHGYLPNQARIVYLPLDVLAIKSEMAATALEWYGELWVGPPPPSPPLIQGNLTVIPARATSVPVGAVTTD